MPDTYYEYLIPNKNDVKPPSDSPIMNIGISGMLL